MLEWTTLDFLPEWLFFLCSLALSVGAVEAGYRFGLYRYQSTQGEAEKETPTGSIVAATLGLLAFLLAFTFSMAANRFENRRELFQREVDAIGTTYLRADFLPEDHGPKAAAWLREYVDLRVEATRANAADLEKLIRRSEELHEILWRDAVIAAKKVPDSHVVPLYVTSLNEMIDLHSERLTAAIRARIPARIWTGLILVATVAMFSAGYQAGLVNSSRPFSSLGMAFCFVIALQLTLELDRPGDRILTLNPQAMIDLQESMKKGAP